ncbi:MAG: radical SAM protein [Spirochaetota bacterium]
MIGIIKSLNSEEKLDILAGSARYDVCLASCSGNFHGGRGRVRDPGNPISRWIYPAHIPGKGQVGILKVLQTNACKNNCAYCHLSARNDTIKRVGFSPRELADIFIQFVQKHRVHGLFISSGVGFNADSAMEKMIHTAEILRNKYKFKGYIHLKILPGSSYNLMERAAQLADRISINLEAPTKDHLRTIAPDKNFMHDLITRLQWAGDLIRKNLYTKSHTTQFVVGASNETDLDILKTVDWIYREMFVFRAYFSAFQPFEALTYPAVNDHTLLREHRLYQSDFLLRGYGFRLHDLVFDKNGHLPKNVDPKTAYARLHPEIFPVDINRASKEELLKVPGIGPLSAQRIAETRGNNPFHNLAELKQAGAVVKWAAPYIEFSGKKDKHLESGYSQPWLFDELSSTGWCSEAGSPPP